MSAYDPKRTLNDPADSIYKVVSGLVCTTKFLIDGRRQISGFYLPGDYFGLECSGAHTLSAGAVTNAKVRIIKKSVLAMVANRDEQLRAQGVRVTLVRPAEIAAKANEYLEPLALLFGIVAIPVLAIALGVCITILANAFR